MQCDGLDQPMESAIAVPGMNASTAARELGDQPVVGDRRVGIHVVQEVPPIPQRCERIGAYRRQGSGNLYDC